MNDGWTDPSLEIASSGHGVRIMVFGEHLGDKECLAMAEAYEIRGRLLRDMVQRAEYLRAALARMKP